MVMGLWVEYFVSIVGSVRIGILMGGVMYLIKIVLGSMLTTSTCQVLVY